MHSGEISDYSDLTGGQYEGLVLKRERHYKWRPYWCVLRGRQLTFYDDSEKTRVAGRIEIQPGSRCEKYQKDKFSSFKKLVHKDYYNTRKYPLQLKTKRGTHLFTYENIKEQTLWQMAINNASQEDASGVRLSWIPTPFSMVSSPLECQRSSLSPVEQPSSDPGSDDARPLQDSGSPQIALISVPLNRPKATCKPRTRRDDLRKLIPDSDSEMSDGLANPIAHVNTKEMITSL